jgi:hypothetical protein
MLTSRLKVSFVIAVILSLLALLIVAGSVFADLTVENFTFESDASSLSAPPRIYDPGFAHSGNYIGFADRSYYHQSLLNTTNIITFSVWVRSGTFSPRDEFVLGYTLLPWGANELVECGRLAQNFQWTEVVCAGIPVTGSYSIWFNGDSIALDDGYLVNGTYPDTPTPMITVTPTPTSTPITSTSTTVNVLVDGNMEQQPVSSGWSLVVPQTEFGRMQESLFGGFLNGGDACSSGSGFQAIGKKRGWPWDAPAVYGPIQQSFTWPGGPMYWSYTAKGAPQSQPGVADCGNRESGGSRGGRYCQRAGHFHRSLVSGGGRDQHQFYAGAVHRKILQRRVSGRYALSG